jgi:hypothetical protein
MANKRKTDNSSPDAAKAAPITLADLLICNPLTRHDKT